MRKITLAITIAISFAGSPLWAHEDDAQAWLKVRAVAKISEAAELQLETNQRISETDGLYESQYLMAVGIDVLGGVTFAAGVNRVVEMTDGRVDSTEWRPRQQISFPITSLGGGELAGRVRFEQRFRSGSDDVGHRFRPEISYTFPVGDVFKLTLAHESYFELNRTDFGQRGGHERMRNSIGVALPVSEAIDVELGYMNQYRFNDEAPDLMEHALNAMVTLKL